MKKLGIAIGILIITLVFILQNTYAINFNKKEKNFFEVNKHEISAGDTLEMQINIDSINLEKSKFVLSSNFDLNNIYNLSDEISIEKENNDIVLEIDKSKLELNKIIFYYNIPKEIQVGSKLILRASIESIPEQTENSIIEDDKNEEIDKEKDEIDIGDNLIQETNENNNTQINEIDICEIIVTIIEKSEENSDNNDKNLNGENKETNPDLIGDKVNEESQTGLTNKEIQFNSILSASKANISENSEKIIYNGSGNNYLESLEIEGVELNKLFNKESSTYFTTVDDTISSITVTAIAEDENASVCMYGTDNLKEVENKVLISVTAENGNVRNYRIYVNK